jgi:hypothetical protein
MCNALVEQPRLRGGLVAPEMNNGKVRYEDPRIIRGGVAYSRLYVANA